MKITGREKKVIITGGAIVAAALIYFFADALLPSRAALSADVAAKKRTLVAQRELLGQEESYKTRIEQYRKRLEHDRTRLLPGDNPNVAGAELQRVLKDLADRAGVDITRKDFQREQRLQDNLMKVPVHIETQCNADQLIQFLAAVENYEKFLTVDELSIASYPMQRRYETRPSITVSGYIAAPPEVKPAAKAASQ
ncbi:MAG TPA: type II secretion system protein GspM [Acidobacteriota bacterium]|nr:type II secretion system protein GspM [Acidobacteriota bacterium]